MEKKKEAYVIGLDNSLRSSTEAPAQYIPESEKTPEWYYQNLNYILGFYNQPVGSIDFNSVNTGAYSAGASVEEKTYPVQFMLKMMNYYLGEQPNMTFNHLTPNITTTNAQAQWIKGQDVSEFVNYFKGLIMQRITNLRFNAKPMSRDAVSKRDEHYNALMLKFDLKPLFEQMAQGGVTFNPEGNSEIESPEDVQKWMDTNFKEYGAIVATTLANGIWFSNDWVHKCLQSAMYVIITSVCAMEHYVANGKTYQEPILPHHLIMDSRFDNDFGAQDQFIGAIRPMTPQQIFSDSRFTLSHEQKNEIQEMAKSGGLGSKYNVNSNIVWWNQGMGENNTVTVATVYFRGLRDTGKKKEKSVAGKEYIAEGKYGEDGAIMLNDVYKATLIGNKYLTNFGLVDNLVEDAVDKSYPCLPIIRFMPNTFMGQSRSEVARIHKIQDEMDFLDFKVREMLGKAKGKVYIISDKYAQSLPAEFVEDISTIGVHFAKTASEFNEARSQARGVELIDWSLDPNIAKLAELYRERKDRMGKILSASELSRGQQSKYTGLGVLQGAINQNSFGVAYLIDGYLDWIVLNMRYAVNQAKNLYSKYEKKAVSFLLGDKGVAYLDFTKDLLFESMWIELVVNNLIDNEKLKRILTIAQADAQNGKLSTSDYMKLENSTSSVEMEEYFEYKENKNKQEMEKQQAQSQQMAMQQAQMQQHWEEQLQQLKDDNANFRAKYAADIAAITKGYTELLKNPPVAPIPSEMGVAQPTQ